MADYILAHLNVVRPLGDFSAADPRAVFFLEQLQKIFSVADGFPEMKWHNHGVRSADGRFVGLEDLLGLQTQRTEDNPHIMTMAGWIDLKGFRKFAYRDPLHVAGMKRLQHWVDRSEGPTMVMWWAPAGQRVKLSDGWDRLSQLRTKGPGPNAFTPKDFHQPPA